MARPIRLLLVLVLLVAPMGLWITSATAAAPTFTITPNPVTAGGTLTFSGTSCLPASADPADQGPLVYLAAENDQSGGTSDAITPEPDGTWSYTISVPEGLPSQTVTFDAVCDGYTSSFDYPPVTVRIHGSSEGSFLFLPAFVDVWNRPPVLEVNTTYEFNAFGFAPGEQVELDLHSDPVPLGTYLVNERGEVIGTFRIPAGTAGGDHELRLTGVSSESTASLAVVVAPLVIATSPPASAPPSTSMTDIPSSTSLGSATTAVSTVTSTSAAPGPGLAATGSPAGGLTTVGLTLAALGSGILWLARRPLPRRRSH